MLIRHDYKRAVYRAMLSELPPQDVIEFFNLESLILDGEPVQGKRLFELLWSEKGKITCCYDYKLDNRMERFLISKGKDTAAILKKVLWLNNNSTHIPGKVLLTWFYPKLEAVFDSVDTRDMVFAMITIFTENWLPHHIHRRVKRWEEGDWTHSVMIFHADPIIPGLENWDLELIAGPQILNSPGMFALPPFEGFGMISEYCEAETIIWDLEDRPVREGVQWFIRGEAYGRVRSFLDFCAEKEIDLSMKHLFEAHVHESKCDFEYRDLKRIFEITQGQKNSNFEVRFYRLVDKLNRECPGVRIEKTGRGQFRLYVGEGFQYRAIHGSAELAGIGTAR